MDLTDTIQPNSDQLDAVDLLGGPRTFTITKVSEGNAEQPVNIQLAEFPRVWRPGKSMRRVLVACWGKDASAYVGRRLTLFCDPSVKFGGEAVGGTRISHLSHLDKPKSIPLLVTRGKSAMFKVQPLVEQAPRPAVAPNPDGITQAQLTKLAISLKELGMTDREKGLAYLSDTVGRPITSSKELTKAEASRVIEDLAQAGQPAPEGEEPPADPWAGQDGEA